MSKGKKLPDLIVCFGDSEALGGNIAAELRRPLQLCEPHVFPDGERLVELPIQPNLSRVSIVRSLNDPDHKLIELVLAAAALRDQGVEEIDLVAPYLGYMRQDIAFRPGQAVSQRVIGQLVARSFDAVLTVDPHLHRTHDLAQVFPGCRTAALSAAGLIGAYHAGLEGRDYAAVIGPDVESTPLTEAVAVPLGAAPVVGAKVRRGDRDVSIELPALPASARDEGKRVLIVDDMVSSGQTILKLVGELRSQGCKSFDLSTVHALFGEEIMASFEAGGIGDIVSANTIEHSTNSIDVAPLIAEALDYGS